MLYSLTSSSDFSLVEPTVSVTPDHNTGVTRVAAGTRFEVPKHQVQQPKRTTTDSPGAPFRRESLQFKIKKNWEGVVTTVQEKTFHAEMRNTGDKQARATDQFEIEFDNVPLDDLQLVKPGAVFYLTLGVITIPGEGPQKTTRLVFRRMPRWSKRDTEGAERDTDALYKALHAVYLEQYPESGDQGHEVG